MRLTGSQTVTFIEFELEGGYTATLRSSNLEGKTLLIKASSTNPDWAAAQADIENIAAVYGTFEVEVL